jgi:hypothetical protein
MHSSMSADTGGRVCANMTGISSKTSSARITRGPMTRQVKW